MTVFAKFMLSGVPAFIMAVPFNWFLVTHMHVPRMVAYAVVLLFQMTVNFVVCRRYVFDLKDRCTLGRQYVTFIAGNAGIRSLDWALYSLIVSFRPAWFLFVQLANVALFSIVKFLFARFVFRMRSQP